MAGDGGDAVAEGGGAGGGIGATVSQILRMVVVGMVVNKFVGGNLGGGQQGKPPATQFDGIGGGSGIASVPKGPPQGGIQPQGSANKGPIGNAWSPRQPMDLRVYVSESQAFDSFEASALIWEERGLRYTREESSDRERNITISASERVQGNQSSLWLHVYLSKAGLSPDPRDGSHHAIGTTAAHYPLVKLVKKTTPKKTRNLLSGESPTPDGGSRDVVAGDAVAEAEGPAPGTVEWVPHWKPSLIISVVEDFTVYPGLSSVPPQVLPSLQVDDATNRYLPVLFLNDFCPTVATRTDALWGLGALGPWGLGALGPWALLLCAHSTGLPG